MDPSSGRIDAEAVALGVSDDGLAPGAPPGDEVDVGNGATDRSADEVGVGRGVAVRGAEVGDGAAVGLGVAGAGDGGGDGVGAGDGGGDGVGAGVGGDVSPVTTRVPPSRSGTVAPWAACARNVTCHSPAVNVEEPVHVPLVELPPDARLSPTIAVAPSVIRTTSAQMAVAALGGWLLT
jgi:hypothetical protein